MNDGSRRSQEYLVQAERADRAAAETPLENLRQRHAQAAAVWRELAAQEAAREILRNRRAAMARERLDTSAEARSKPAA